MGEWIDGMVDKGLMDYWITVLGGNVNARSAQHLLSSKRRRRDLLMEIGIGRMLSLVEAAC